MADLPAYPIRCTKCEAAAVPMSSLESKVTTKHGFRDPGFPYFGTSISLLGRD